MTEHRTIDPSALDEYDRNMDSKCEHGCYPGEWCADCEGRVPEQPPCYCYTVLGDNKHCPVHGGIL